MSKIDSTISIYRDSNDTKFEGTVVVIPPAMEAEFKRMVARAMSTWQNVSPEMRDFADRLLERDKVVGHNMKWELLDAFRIPVLMQVGTKLRPCCGTSIYEPHMNQCTELSKPPRKVKHAEE